MSETETGLTTTTPSGELTIPQLAGNMDKLREVMRSVMKEGSDFGSIPGTGSKPTLLKPGGEKLAMMFRFCPEYHEEMTLLPEGHREYQVKCRLIHVPSQAFVGEASAVCSTMESKYRYRGGAILCPTCGKSAIIKGKAEYGGGWLCFKRKGGCGAKFPEMQFNDGMLTKIENPDIADSYNTVKQIAQKRAFISAVKTATATSELFTQDVEDGVVPGVEVQNDGTPPYHPGVENEHHPEPTTRRETPKPVGSMECPDSGKAMTLRTANTGKNAGGKFWGCSGYPNCKKTMPIADDGEGQQYGPGATVCQGDPPQFQSEKPKPQDSREWGQLKEALYAAHCRQGHPEDARAMIHSLVGDKVTLEQCVKDYAAAKEVLDAIDAAVTLHGYTNEDLAKQAGLAVEAETVPA